MTFSLLPCCGDPSGDVVASKVEICAILKWGMRKLEIYGSFQVGVHNFKIVHQPRQVIK